MEKNPYTMAKLGLESNGKLHSQRDCGFYAKYVFLFLSLIQFLIILGLVLFMVYGNNRAATEKHLQGMSIWLQECRVQTGALAKEKANLTSLLNASRVENRQMMAEVKRHNTSVKFCLAEKVKVQVLLRQAESTISSYRECYQILSFFNATYPDKVKSLQEQLKAKSLQAELEKKSLEQENQRLQAQVKKAEQEEAACQREVLQVRTQVKKAGELEHQVMGEMQAANLHLKGMVETALPSQTIWSCNTEEVRNLQTTCNNLSKQLDGYMATLGHRLEDRVNTVAQDIALLKKEKEACAQGQQDLSSKLKAQEQQAAQERDLCSTTKAKIYAEQQKLFDDKEALQQELDKIKQKCWAGPQPRVPGASGGTSPFGSFPGNFNPVVPMAPNAFNPHWPRAGALHAPPRAFGDLGPHGNLPAQRNSTPLGNVGSHRTSSHTGHTKPEEGKKPVGADAISPYQPLLKPAGQPRCS
uniref:plasmalemma vesicle-associated protein n=1 Tax=Euleptes europaea TaxID=460621 RepID=UPI0025416B79|nr:plasmalemma vesicle-associated protein [Euleptes europaea]